KSSTAIGIGKSVVACGNHTGNEQSQIVQALVFGNAGERGQLRSGKSVRHLRLRRLNQRRVSSDFHGGAYFSHGQGNRAQTAVASGRNNNIVLYRGLETCCCKFNLVCANRNEVEME